MEIINLDENTYRHVCARNSKAIIEYILRFYGSDLLPRIFDQILDGKNLRSQKYFYQGKPIDISYFKNIENWYNNEINLRLFQNIDAAGINLKDVGRFSIKNSSVSNNITVIGMLHILGPAKTAKKVNEINAFFNKTKKVELINFKNGKGIIKLKYHSNFCHTELVTLQNIGVYQGVWETVGFPNVKINVLEDDFSAGGHTILEFIWKPASFFNRLRWLTGLTVTRLFAKTYAQSNHCIEHYHTELISHYQNEIRQRIANLKERDSLNEQLQQEKNRKERELREKVQEKTKALNEALQRKEDMLADVSHELRTPISAIKGPTDLLIQNTDKPQHLKHLEIISNNLDKLTSLTDQLLLLENIANMNPTRFETVDLYQMTKQVSETYQEQLEKRQMMVEFNIPQKSVIKCNPQHFSQIIDNLLSNAIKYAGYGTLVTIEAQKFKKSLRLTIEDNGAGVATDDKKRIFDRFYRANHHKKYKGSGLGLNIVKKLVQLNKGTITIDTKTDIGTKFILHFSKCIEDQRQIDHKVVNWKHGKKQRVMVVEDSADLRHVIYHNLKADYAIIEASDGLQALEVVENDLPDLILLDIKMPDMDGHQFLSELKNLPRCKHIPVIILSAFYSKTYKLKSLKLQANDHIRKPVDFDELKLKIKSLLDIKKI
ncbi:MAG: response regulator [Xanthomonadales bacterium]|nr:response regulator [Xanthomonadales bacterium]